MILYILSRIEEYYKYFEDNSRFNYRCPAMKEVVLGILNDGDKNTITGGMDLPLLQINQQSQEKVKVLSGQTRRLVKVKEDIPSLKLVKFPVTGKGET